MLSTTHRRQWAICVRESRNEAEIELLRTDSALERYSELAMEKKAD